MVLVLAVVLPIQRLTREVTGDRLRRETWLGRVLLVLLMVVTIVPFVSLFVTALHPPGTYPSGLELAGDAALGELRRRVPAAADMGALLWSSVLIEIGVVPVALLIATLAGFALGHLRPPGHRAIFLIVRARPDAAVRGRHRPAVLPDA